MITMTFPTAEEILDTYRDTIGKDFDGYHNHVTRMLAFAHHLLPDCSNEDSCRLLPRSMTSDYGRKITWITWSHQLRRQKCICDQSTAKI